jgi:ParB/RepB/Spo0J family partition protein
MSKEKVETTSTSEVELRKTTRKDYYMVDPRSILVDETFNIREDYGDIEELANSILENGIKTPLRGSSVGGDKYKLTDGFRRMRAVKLLLEKDPDAIKSIPFIPEPKTYSDEQRYFDMFITNSGKNLTALEEGKLFIKLEVLGYTRDEISQKIGKTLAHISNMVGLYSSPKEVKNLIADGSIKPTTANKLRRETSSDAEFISVINQGLEEAKKIGKTKVTQKEIEKVFKSKTKDDNTLLELKELRLYLTENSTPEELTTNVKFQTLNNLIGYLTDEQDTMFDEILNYLKS